MQLSVLFNVTMDKKLNCMNIKKKLKKNLFARFYWGIATEEEKKEIYQSEESEEMLQEDWKQSSTNKLNDEINHQKILSEIRDNTKENQSGTGKIRMLSNRFSRYAAAVLIPILFIGSLYYMLVLRPDIISNIAMVEKSNPKGQRSELVLPDGSKVYLNAASTIRYPEKFMGRKRNIYLDGEAYFDVVHKSSKPFIVKTSELDIEVLGTSFNVKSFTNEKTIETTLVEGKVSVKKMDEETGEYQRAILLPQHQATYFKNQNRFTLEKVNVKKYTSWKKGMLIFDNDSFEELSKVLERWYNINIVIENESLQSNYFTLTITNESIDEVLRLLKKSTPRLQINKEGSDITFY